MNVGKSSRFNHFLSFISHSDAFIDTSQAVLTLCVLGPDARTSPCCTVNTHMAAVRHGSPCETTFSDPEPEPAPSRQRRSVSYLSSVIFHPLDMDFPPRLGFGLIGTNSWQEARLQSYFHSLQTEFFF